MRRNNNNNLTKTTCLNNDIFRKQLKELLAYDECQEKNHRQKKLKFKKLSKH